MEREHPAGSPHAIGGRGLSAPSPGRRLRPGGVGQGVAADEAAADDARVRFARDGLPAVDPDTRIAPLLGPDEGLVAEHRDAQLERREPSPGCRIAAGLEGDLYVTSRRLLLVGRLTLAFALDSIDDAVVSGERLLLVLRDGHGVALQVAQPRLLWVQISLARASVRPAQRSDAPSSPVEAAR